MDEAGNVSVPDKSVTSGLLYPVILSWGLSPFCPVEEHLE